MGALEMLEYEYEYNATYRASACAIDPANLLSSLEPTASDRPPMLLVFRTIRDMSVCPKYTVWYSRV